MRLQKKALLTVVVLVLAALCGAKAQRPKAATSSSQRAKTAPAHYYGAVDLGSKGTKASLYSFVMEEEGRNPVSIYDSNVNTTIVASMKDGKFSKEGIADATKAVRQVVDEMRAEAARRHLSVDTYYVIGSSGVAKGTNKEDLVASVKDATGIDMDFVDAAREGYYGMRSAVPLNKRDTSIYVDVGSGNTKLGCLVGDADLKNFKSAEIPFGSVSLTNEAVKVNPKDINSGIAQSIDDKVVPQYEQDSRNIPCLRNRPRVYWTGGAAWAAASVMHPEKAMSGYVIIPVAIWSSTLPSSRTIPGTQKKSFRFYPRTSLKSSRTKFALRPTRSFTTERKVW